MTTPFYSPRWHTLVGLLGSGIATTSVGFVFTMLFARMAIPAEFGLYSSAIAFAQMYGAIMEFGMSIELHRTNQSSDLIAVFSDALRIVFVVLFSVLLFTVCMGIIQWIYGIPPTSLLVAISAECLALLWIAIRTISAHYMAISVVQQHVMRASIIDIACILSAHAIAIVAVAVVRSQVSGYLPHLVLVIFVGVELIKLFSLHSTLTQRQNNLALELPTRILLRVCRNPLQEATIAFHIMRMRMTLLAVQALSGVEQRWGILMAGQSFIGGSYESVALFSAPYRLINGLRVSIGVIQKALLREFSSQQNNSLVQLVSSRKRILIILGTSCIGIALWAGIWWYADTLMILIYGGQYAHTGSVLRWQLWLLPTQLFAIIAESYLLAHNRERVVVVLVSIELCVMTAIAFCTPLWFHQNSVSMVNAAIGSIVSAIAVSGMSMVALVSGYIALTHARRIATILPTTTMSS